VGPASAFEISSPTPAIASRIHRGIVIAQPQGCHPPRPRCLPSSLSATLVAVTKRIRVRGERPRSPSATFSQREIPHEQPWALVQSPSDTSISHICPFLGILGRHPERRLPLAPGDRRSLPAPPSYTGFPAGLVCFHSGGLGSLGGACLRGRGGRIPGEGDLMLAQVPDHPLRADGGPDIGTSAGAAPCFRSQVPSCIGEAGLVLLNFQLAISVHSLCQSQGCLAPGPGSIGGWLHRPGSILINLVSVAGCIHYFVSSLPGRPGPRTIG
jgi:hypothetical protein